MTLVPSVSQYVVCASELSLTLQILPIWDLVNLGRLPNHIPIYTSSLEV